MGTPGTLTPGNDRPDAAGLAAAAGVWRRWRTRLSAGVLDQAIVSGANFVLNVQLARWLVPSEYGGFAIGYALIVLLGGPHGALLIDPLNIVGTRLFRPRPRAYLRTVIVIHALAVLIAGAVIAAGAASPSVVLAVGLRRSWLIALGATTPLVLSLWLLRSACYLEMRPGHAVAGSVVYASILFTLVAAVHAAGRLNPSTALGVMGLASAVAATAIAISLGLATPPLEVLPIRAVAQEHWSYGRWILGASLAHGAANGLYLPLVAALVGLEQTAALRALQNLVLPLQQGLAGITLVAYPSMARGVADRGRAYLRRRGFAFCLLYVGAAGVYGLAIAVVKGPLLTIMYGHGYYAGYASLVPVFALVAVGVALAQSLSILVRVTDRPQAVLAAKLAAAVWLGVVGIALVERRGVAGAIASLGGGAVVEAVVLAVALRYAAPRSSAPMGHVLERLPEA